MPEVTAEEMLKQFRLDLGRIAILFRRYACGERGDLEFEIALLTTGAEQERLWRQLGRLQKLMAIQGKEGYTTVKLTQEQVREISEYLEYLGKQPVFVDRVGKTATYILTRCEPRDSGWNARQHRARN